MRDAIVPAALRSLAALADSLSEAVAAVDTGAPGSPIVYANAAWARLAGLPADDVAGRALGAFVPDLEEPLVACVDRGERRCQFRPVRGGPVPVAVTLSHADGETQDASTYAIVRALRAADPVPRSRYERVVKGAPDGLFEWDLDSGSAWYSPRFRELLGEAGAGLENSFASFSQLLLPEDRGRILTALRQHLEQRQPLEVDFRLVTADGGSRWLRLRGNAERDATGRPVRAAGLLADADARLRAESDAADRERRLREALDSLTASIGVLDATGSIIEINTPWRTAEGDGGMTGLRYGFGEDYSRLLRNAAVRCPAAPQAADLVDEVLGGQRETARLGYSLDAGGRQQHLELRVQAFMHGAERMALVTHEDVGALRDVTLASQRAQEFFELILDSVPLLIAYISRDGRFVYANAAYEKFFGLPASAIEGRRLEEIVSDANYRDVAPRIMAVLAGRVVEFESRVDHGSEPRDVAVTYLPHADGDGQVRGFFSVVRDITEQKRLETGLRHAQKMEAIGRLTGGIAHDFNNLLNVVIGNLQLLERPLAGEARLLRSAQTALRAALRGAELTQRLLAFARQQRLEPRLLDANALLDGMRDLVVRGVGDGIEIRMEQQAAIWPMQVDPGQLENSILNLAINGRDAMDGRGVLTLATRNATLGEAQPAVAGLVPGDYVVIEVRDDGCGMPADVVKRAFEPFFTTKDAGKGTGLGLAMVYGFAQQSGGTAVIQSAPGAGTTVQLWFPRGWAAPAMAERVFPADGPAVPRGTETILIVEDETDVRETARVALEALGYQVLEAADAAAALAILDGPASIQAVFSDVMLSGTLRGTDVVARARELRPGIAALLTTGFADTTVLGQVMLDGSVEVLAKPYTIEDLARRMRATLDGEPDSD